MDVVVVVIVLCADVGIEGDVGVHVGVDQYM